MSGGGGWSQPGADCEQSTPDPERMETKGGGEAEWNHLVLRNEKGSFCCFLRDFPSPYTALWGQSDRTVVSHSLWSLRCMCVLCVSQNSFIFSQAGAHFQPKLLLFQVFFFGVFTPLCSFLSNCEVELIISSAKKGIQRDLSSLWGEIVSMLAELNVQDGLVSGNFSEKSINLYLYTFLYLIYN